jgi:hypothetical protein
MIEDDGEVTTPPCGSSASAARPAVYCSGHPRAGPLPAFLPSSALRPQPAGRCPWLGAAAPRGSQLAACRKYLTFRDRLLSLTRPNGTRNRQLKMPQGVAESARARQFTKSVPIGELISAKTKSPTRGFTRQEPRVTLSAFFVYPYGVKGFATNRPVNPAVSFRKPKISTPDQTRGFVSGC